MLGARSVDWLFPHGMLLLRLVEHDKAAFTITILCQTSSGILLYYNRYKLDTIGDERYIVLY